jgi:hypothetical protein
MPWSQVWQTRAKKPGYLKTFLQLALADHSGVKVIAELKGSNLNLEFPNSFTQCALGVQALMLG